MRNIRILALSGSLRKKSYNTAILNAASELAPAGMEIVVFNDIKSLPLFNPDREDENISVVNKLLKEVEISNGLMISSPEYAHGISGVMKNALDWLVSSEQFPYKPVALFNTSPRATHAQAALRGTYPDIHHNNSCILIIRAFLFIGHYAGCLISARPELALLPRYGCLDKL